MDLFGKKNNLEIQNLVERIRWSQIWMIRKFENDHSVSGQIIFSDFRVLLINSSIDAWMPRQRVNS